MQLSEFDFSVPLELIANYPLSRGKSKMLVCSRNKYDPLVSQSENLIDYLNPGDALVLNNTKVFLARVYGTCENKKVECLLLENVKTTNEGCYWSALVRPAKFLSLGKEICFSNEVKAEVAGLGQRGERELKFNFKLKSDFDAWLETAGNIPLPPYITREDEVKDRESYQSVFAKELGSAAAPTASLHLSNEHLKEIKEKGIHIAFVTLHVGIDTFRPIQSEKIENHKIHGEKYSISKETCKVLQTIKKEGENKIVAIGTTVARVLETVYTENNEFVASSGVTHHYIYPGYSWKAVNVLLTNFHWPKSSLYLLVSSLLGVEETRRYYNYVIQERFRLFSYGDCMLIL